MHYNLIEENSLKEEKELKFYNQNADIFREDILSCNLKKIVKGNDELAYYLISKKLFNIKLNWKNISKENLAYININEIECNVKLYGIEHLHFNYYLNYFNKPIKNLKSKKTMDILKDFKKNEFINILYNSFLLKVNKKKITNNNWILLSELKNYTFKNKNDYYKNISFMSRFLKSSLFTHELKNKKYNFILKHNIKSNKLKKLDIYNYDLFNYMNKENPQTNLNNLNNNGISYKMQSFNIMNKNQTKADNLNYYRKLREKTIGQDRKYWEKFIELEEKFIKSNIGLSLFMDEYSKDYYEIVEYFPMAFLRLFDYEYIYSKNYNKVINLLDLKPKFDKNIVWIINAHFYSSYSPYYNLDKTFEYLNKIDGFFYNEFFFDQYNNILLRILKVINYNLVPLKPKLEEYKVLGFNYYLYSLDFYFKNIKFCVDNMIKVRIIFDKLIKYYKFFNLPFFDFYIFNILLFVKKNIKNNLIDIKFWKNVNIMMDSFYFEVFIKKSYRLYKWKNYLDSLIILNFCSILGSNICTFRLYKLLNSKKLKNFNLEKIKKQNKNLIYKNKTIELFSKISSLKINKKNEYKLLKKLYNHNRSNEHLFYLLDYLAVSKHKNYDIYFNKLVTKINKNKLKFSDYIYTFKNIMTYYKHKIF